MFYTCRFCTLLVWRERGVVLILPLDCRLVCSIHVGSVHCQLGERAEWCLLCHLTEGCHVIYMQVLSIVSWAIGVERCLVCHLTEGLHVLYM